MKKIISLATLCLIIVGMMLTLASCGLSGSYKNGQTTLTFKGDTVTVVIENEIKGTIITTTYEAEYEIIEKDDSRTIKFTYAEGADKYLALMGEKSFSEGEKDGQKYIQIGLITYYKTK